MARSTKAQEEKEFKEQVRADALKVAKNAIRKASISPDYTEDDPDMEDELDEDMSFNLGLDEEPMSATDRFSAVRGSENNSDDDADMDIFDRFNKSTDFPVNYSIQRNGELLAKKDAPYSWDELQNEFGKGMYKVIAKNCLNGRILKHESKSVAQPINHNDKLAEKAATERESVRDILTTVNTQFTESLNAVQAASARQTEIMMRQMESEKEERRRLEEKQREEIMELRKATKEQEGGTTTLLATLLPLLMKKDDGGDSTMKMMLEIQKMNAETQKETQKLIMEIQKENREEARRMQEATNNMINTLVIEMKPKESKPDFDALTIMKMMQDAESKGMEKMKDFMDLADERAERRIEEMKEDKPEKDDGGVIQNTLKMLLPVLVQQGMGGGMPRPTAPAPEDRLIAQHRPSSPAPSQAQPIKKNVITAKATPVKTPAKPVVTPVATPVHTVKAPQAVGTNTVVEKTPKEDTMSREEAKELVINVATPILGQAFTSYLADKSFDAKLTADQTIYALKTKGISPSMAIELVSAEDIIATCHSYGLASDETDKHLRDYYANIKASATT